MSATDLGRERGDFVWQDMTPVAEELWAPEYPKEYKVEEFGQSAVLVNTHYSNLHQDQNWDAINDFFCVVPTFLKAWPLSERLKFALNALKYILLLLP